MDSFTFTIDGVATYEVTVKPVGTAYHAVCSLTKPHRQKISEASGPDKITVLQAMAERFKRDHERGIAPDNKIGEAITREVNRALKAIGEHGGQDEDEKLIYADYPPWMTKPAHKKNFQKLFREWAHYVRGGADALEIAERLEKANPGNRTGDIGFLAQIEMMFNGATRFFIAEALRQKRFVRFNIRTEAGKKIWFAI